MIFFPSCVHRLANLVFIAPIGVILKVWSPCPREVLTKKLILVDLDITFGVVPGVVCGVVLPDVDVLFLLHKTIDHIRRF